MKVVVVTGAAGFLGSHLALHHLAQGDQVLGIDNFCSSKRNSTHVDVLNSFPLWGQLVDVDVTNRATLKYSIDNFIRTVAKQHGKVHLIYNFACPASPPVYQAIPVETMMTCTVGTKNVLDVALKHNATVVHASTSEVYGDPEESPQREAYRGNVNPYGPRSCYDEGKRAAEALCYDYLHKHSVDVRLVRIFNTYGPHMDPNDGRVISNFICQALRHEPLTIYGDGSQTRSFCYVDDLIRGITSLAELRQNPLTPVNLGNPSEFSIRELADLVQKLLGPQQVVEKPFPVDDPLQRRPDISLARDLLGWSPVVTLDEGLKRAVNYFKEVLRVP